MKKMLTIEQIKKACKLADEDKERNSEKFWYQCFGRMAAELNMSEEGAHEAYNLVSIHEGYKPPEMFNYLRYPEVDKHFSDLPFRIVFAKGRGRRIPSTKHEVWVLYNLIEMLEPKKVWGIPKVIDGHAILEEGYLIMEKFYRGGTSGQEGPDKCIEAVIPNIKIERKNGEVVYVGYQRSIDMIGDSRVTPDFTVYTEVEEITVEPEEDGEVSIYFDDKLFSKVVRNSNYPEFLEITRPIIAPYAIIDAKESLSAFRSNIRSNLSVYADYPSKIKVVVAPKINKKEISGFMVVEDTFNEECVKEGNCNKRLLQDRLRSVLKF